MEEMAPQAGLNLLPVNDIGPDTAILLKEKLDRGEWIAIVGDRIAVTTQRGGEWRVCWSRFMGQVAPFHRAVHSCVYFTLSGGSDFRPAPAGETTHPLRTIC